MKKWEWTKIKKLYQGHRHNKSIEWFFLKYNYNFKYSLNKSWWLEFWKCQRFHFKSYTKISQPPNQYSILAMKEKTKAVSVLTFSHVTREDVMKDMKDWDVSKSSQENDISTKTFKEITDIFSNFIYQSFNNMADVYIFQASLKLANITPKKGPKNSKKNYRPVSILPNT